MAYNVKPVPTAYLVNILYKTYSSYKSRFWPVMQGLLTMSLMRQGGNRLIWVKILGSSQSSMMFMKNIEFFGGICYND